MTAMQWNINPQNFMLGSYFGTGGAGTAPSSFWLALGSGTGQTGTPGGTFLELAVGNYARQQLTWTLNQGTGTDPATGYTLTWAYVVSNQVSFANLNAGSVLGHRIYDAKTGGNILFWSDLDTTYSWDDGETLTYPAIQIGWTSSS